ncbi:MAG: tetratricopeptide repeat protein [Planctomycetota bacterium]|jgi:tetratricopeptide (TPR) repeat protein
MPYCKYLTVLVAFALHSTAFAGNFAQEFQKADKLMAQRKFAEAEKSFNELLGSKERRVRRDPVYYELAACALNLKDVEKAESYASNIKDKTLKKSFYLRLLTEQRNNSKIAELYKNEDISIWPENLIYDAAVNRSRAFTALENYKAAEKDLLLALQYTIVNNQKCMAYLSLGSLYENYIKDYDKALAAYENGINSNGKLGNLAGNITAFARLATAKGDTEKALSAMQKMDVEKVNHAHWQEKLLSCYGDIYAKANDSKNALKYYERALAVEGISESAAKVIKDKIAELTTTSEQK